MSYWTKRRKTLASVQQIEKEILDEYQTQTENTDESSVLGHKRQNSGTRDLSSFCSIVSFLAPTHENSCDVEKNTNADFSFDSETPSDPGSTSDSDQPNAESDSSSNNSLNQLQIKLQTWAASFCIPLVALTALLSILRSEFPDLPKDARTLLGTQTKVPVANICNGEYYHFGLVNGLQNILGPVSLKM